MTLDELKDKLSGFEWKDIEFKEASWAVPKPAYETVSAFSNTGGGWLVFGVQAKEGRFEILGVVDVDKVQNEFVTGLRQKGKFSCGIAFKENALKSEDKTVLVFYIPEVHRSHKPVHLDGKLDESFVRKGGTTQKCTPSELQHFIRNATNERYEDQIIETLDPVTCFDEETIKWYRTLFHERQPGHETEAKSNVEFLEHFGLVQPTSQGLKPTRAALLLFGSNGALHRAFSRQIVDFFVFHSDRGAVLPEQRWDDRIEALSEGNITKSWRKIVDLYRSRFAEQRFELDATTLQRKGAPADYLAFREATLNLLIHQDYADQSRKACITYYNDCVEFWNPGVSFVSGEDFFKPGDKEVRNPRIRAMLSRIGIGEQANTGIRSIYANQRQIGRVPPDLRSDPVDHSFAIRLRKELVQSERQKLLVSKLGIHLSDAEAAIFLHATRQGEIRPLEAQSVCGLSANDTTAALDRLVVQSLLEKNTDVAGGPVFRIARHLLEIGETVTGKGLKGLFTEQAGPATKSLFTEQAQVLAKLTEKHWQILLFCDLPKTVIQIGKHIQVSSRQHVKYQYIDLLLKGGLLKMTDPANPTSPKQAYVVTEAGFELIKNRPQRSLVTDKAAQPQNELDHPGSAQAPKQT